MMTGPTSASAPSRSASLARISAVQQMMGASALTEESPVFITDTAAPEIYTREKNFSETRALIGAV